MASVDLDKATDFGQSASVLPLLKILCPDLIILTSKNIVISI